MNFLLLGLYSVGVVSAVLIARRVTNLLAQVVLNLASSLTLFTILMMVYVTVEESQDPLTLPPLPQHFRWYVAFGILSLVAITLVVRMIPKPEKTKRKNADEYPTSNK